MACEVNVFSKIEDLQQVKAYFGLAEEENWFNAVHVAVSATGKLIVLAQGEKIVFLAPAIVGASNSYPSFQISWLGELDNPNQIITSLLCLPIRSKSAASRTVDWTCVVLGLSSGMVVFYTESGIKIFSQSFQNHAVIALKLRIRPGNSSSGQIFYIVYKDCICLIKLVDLLTLLKVQQRNSKRTSTSSPATDGLQSPDTLSCYKHMLSGDAGTIINDAAVTLYQPKNAYDNLTAQAIRRGYYQRAQHLDIVIKFEQILAVGTLPCSGYYYAGQPVRRPTIKQITKNMVGALCKDFFKNILPEQITAPKTKDPVHEDKLQRRCRFYDGKRVGYAIAMTPGGRFAAVTDNLDRVLLLDNQCAVIVRVWKGYRDAQCAFFVAHDDGVKCSTFAIRRKAWFLVIYAPHVGCLDFYALQNGPKIASFNVSKHGQLISITRGYLESCADSVVVSKMYNRHCVFLDPNDCTLKELRIPFHFALSEFHPETSKDLNVLRQLRAIVRPTTNTDGAGLIWDFEGIAKLAGELVTLEIREQCVEMLLKSKELSPKVFQCVINALWSHIEKNEQQHDDQAELHRRLCNYKNLTDFYLALREKRNVMPDSYEEIELSDGDTAIVSQFVVLRSNVEFQQNETANSDTENGGDLMTDLTEYLAAFSDFIESEPSYEDNDEYKSINYERISKIIFGELFPYGVQPTDFGPEAEASGIPWTVLLNLVLHYWMDRPCQFENREVAIAEMSYLAALVRAICDVAGDGASDYTYSTISPWWQAIREMLFRTKKLPAVLAAIVCKVVSAEIWRKRREGSCDEADENDVKFESISQDETQWGFLILRLEDLAIMNMVLRFPASDCEISRPYIPYTHSDCNIESLKPEGFVVDLVAKWAISVGISPEKIVEGDFSSPKTPESPENTEPIVGGDLMASPTLLGFLILRKRFRISLHSSSLLSVMAWHYMIHWSKNLPSIVHFRAAIECLKHIKPDHWQLKHGMCSMIWNAALKHPLQSTAKLIHKVGRLPVDKLCQQDIEIPSAIVPGFLALCLEFLDELKTSSSYENCDFVSKKKSVADERSLQEIALSQQSAKECRLQLLYTLCSVLHFIAFFQIKQPKPMTTLFDMSSNRAFFEDLSKDVQKSTNCDLALADARLGFLFKVITATIGLLNQDNEDRAFYMKRTFNLADTWCLDQMLLRRRAIVDLYATGHDSEGQRELLECTVDDELCTNLLAVAGQRLLVYIEALRYNILNFVPVGRVPMEYLNTLKAESGAGNIKISATSMKDVDIIATELLIDYLFDYFAGDDHVDRDDEAEDDEETSIYYYIVRGLRSICRDIIATD